ncbi:hypothetical protein [Streptomyces sp. NBC_01451]|uniref:hypothetical protein n=1 Tax=Streptomyces sp. NBC_01451 TaxID=2903872 RepID=UPI002E31A5AB|nr:hypothetical protein [Streptomyces sp. NBC_01451]
MTPAPDLTAPRKPVRRGRIAAVATSVLLVGAVVAGTGYTVVTVDNADRDAGAPVWKFPKAAADEKRKTAPSGLAGLLVPYEADTWERGPDIGEFGSDSLLSGDQATALRKESLRDLPRTQRRRLEKEIDRQPVKGMAMRSYVGWGTEPSTYSEEAFTVSIVLAQMANKATVRDMSRFQSEFMDALDIFRKGPRIEGHKNAKCFLPPKSDEMELDAMYCSAYVGDVLVSATAYAAEPLNTKQVAVLLREQLDRITEPGEAV